VLMMRLMGSFCFIGLHSIRFDRIGYASTGKGSASFAMAGSRMMFPSA
jgi:hypothetical protein